MKSLVITSRLALFQTGQHLRSLRMQCLEGSPYEGYLPLNRRVPSSAATPNLQVWAGLIASKPAVVCTLFLMPRKSLFEGQTVILSTDGDPCVGAPTARSRKLVLKTLQHRGSVYCGDIYCEDGPVCA